ncbi:MULTISPECIES: MarC family protein [Silvimonas]|uniref:MarC family protein n=1 Tax=Silvimonas TaxID=300264 RepID=UPI0024B3B5C6|nr:MULTISPECIES: MarC family protein [Silvimonas]MDR3430062.1 MarC family protein [Silvimonas sp.]
MTHTFLSALVLLLLVTDPLGGLPLFVSLLKTVPRERRVKVIVRETLIAFLILLAFMVFGQAFLRVMHLSETSLGIAGGIILFLIALRMVFPKPEGVFGDNDLNGEPFIVPLAVPLLAGPSALATVLLLVSHDPDRIWEWAGALALTMLVCGLTLLFSERISYWLGERLTQAFERLMGLILTAIAVEMLLAGIRTWLSTLH